MADQTATTEDLLSHLPALLDRLRSRSAGSSPSTSSSGPSSALLAQLGLLSGHGREAGEGGGGKENGDGQSLSANARDVREALTERFLTPKMGLEEKWLGKYQVHWPRERNLQSLLWLEPSASTTSLEFVRAGLEGRIVGYREISHATAPLLTAKTSTSLSRAPAAGSNFVRGRSGFVPFVPGGLEEEVLKEPSGEEEDAADGLGQEVKGMEDVLETGSGLRLVPPGFSRGFFDTGEEEEDGEDEDALRNEDYNARAMAPAPIFRPTGDAKAREHKPMLNGQTARPTGELDAELDELLPVERPMAAARGGRKPALAAKRDWAHVVDVNQTLANFHDLVPDMAHKFPFELDNFQKEAVYHLEQGDSVFVAAHTSAGKTVVAEYAIGLAMKHMTRCIYTSPIKALSNQKFRDFKQTFGAQNVGILTGDVQINPEAPCLIMTTEILRSMLYRGADLIRDVEFVIFDEVHYVNDQERGVVWEEVIILCPQHINLILLSATVPNTKEFADWVGRTKKKDIYVISTPKRPVPLEHFLYAGKDLFKIVDSKSQFLSNGIKEAGEALKRKQEKDREAAGLGPPARGGARGGGRGAAGANSRGGQRVSMTPARGAASPMRGRGGHMTTVRQDKNLWIHLVGLLRKKELLPVVAFVFSKKRCEEYASSMPNTDLCNAREKSEVHVVIERSLTRLKGSDRKLPQIQRMRDLLSRGVGVHHGGLLPIVKEMVEILFQRGLVKVLFATETFAMGVNMPARAVIFSGIRKHDGHGFRDLLAGEYTQMSGRAGRRGLDPTGVVIINAGDEVPETSTLHKMLLGQPTKLQSQFRLTYNMILNLLRVEALKVEEMIKRSFSENASQRLLPDQQKKVQEVEKKLAKLPTVTPEEREQELSLFYDLSLGAVSANQAVLELALEQQQGSKNFAPGRVVILRDRHFDNDPAIIIKSVSSKEFLVLGAVTPERKSGKQDAATETVPPRWPPSLHGHGTEGLVYELREVPLASIALVTKYLQKVDLPRIMDHRISAMQGAVDALVPVIVEMQTNEKGTDALPEVDWSKLRKLEFQEALRSRRGHETKLVQQHCVETDGFEEDYRTTHARKDLQRQISFLHLALSDQNLELLPDYEQRIEVLKALRFIDPVSESVLLKGRVACEINSANELILTELVLDNTFAEYEPEEVVALLSVFVFQEKTDVQPELAPKLAQGYAAILEVADRVAAAQAANKVNFDDFTTMLKTGLVEVVYEWARGMPFEQITDLTDVPEGTIVRVITRLDETCREVRDSARVIGDAELFKKMEECQALIRRDVIFAGSLYF